MSLIKMLVEQVALDLWQSHLKLFASLEAVQYKRKQKEASAKSPLKGAKRETGRPAASTESKGSRTFYDSDPFPIPGHG